MELGAGKEAARHFVNSLRNVVFIDNNRKEKIDEETGLLIYTLAEYIEKNGKTDIEFFICVMNVESQRTIEQQLLAAGIANRNITRISELLNEPSQYFDIFRPNRIEVFVDCGCLDRKSAFGFAAWCGALSYDKIICFEPDARNYEKCKNTVSKLGDCEVHKYAVSDKEGKVSFF